MFRGWGGVVRGELIAMERSGRLWWTDNEGTLLLVWFHLSGLCVHDQLRRAEWKERKRENEAGVGEKQI